MDAFNLRVSQEEAAAILQASLNRGVPGARPAAIFHHLGLMHARIAALKAAFPEQTLHAVAIKSNPVVEILREVVSAGAGLEAASLEEVQLALAAGCPPDRVVFDSPAKTAEEIGIAIRYGVYLNVDNFDELRRVADIRKSCVSLSRVGLRINPMVGGGTIEHTSVATKNSKFGVPLLDSRRILAAFADFRWLTGLHIHVGSQGCGLALLAEAAQRVSDLRREIAARTGRKVTHVDIGGGLSTVYRTGDVAPTPAVYRSLLERRAPDLFAPDLSLVTEFGRAIHANSGIAASRVEYVKPDQYLAVIHLGADFLLRPVYRSDEWRHEFFVFDRNGVPKLGPTAPITVTGPLCFAGDIVARDVSLPPIEAGDWIVIRDVGAYTLSMWSRHCSRAIPAVLGYDPHANQPLRILRRAETSADIVRFWGSADGEQNASREGDFAV